MHTDYAKNSILSLAWTWSIFAKSVTYTVYNKLWQISTQTTFGRAKIGSIQKEIEKSLQIYK